MKGFTLIELVMTLAVAAVIGGVTVAVFLGFRNRQNLDLAGREIVSVLREAQSRSISQASSSGWGVHFENPAAGSDFFASFAGSSYSPAVRDSNYVLRSGVEFSDPSSGGSKDVVFSKTTGLPTVSATVKIYLSSVPSASTTITVSENGSIGF